MTFTLFPSIDIEKGIAVKRIRGQQGTGLVLGDPLKLAGWLVEEGAKWIHVVDLDGAVTGKPVNLVIARAIRNEYGVHVQYGGGIRDVDSALKAFEYGVDRVVVGSLWIKDPAYFEHFIDEIGGSRVVAALEEGATGRLVYDGWRRQATIELSNAIRLLEGVGVYGILYTQTWVEGALMGIDRVRAARIRALTRLPLFLAGGVADIDDILWLCRNKFQGVVLGMALYTRRIRLGEVLAVVKERCG